MAIKFNPTSLTFNYFGSSIAQKELTVLHNGGFFEDQPAHKYFIIYNQSYDNWLEFFNMGIKENPDTFYGGFPNKISLNFNPQEVIPDGSYNADVYFQTAKKDNEVYTILEEGVFRVFLTVSAGVADFTIEPKSTIFHVVKNSNIQNPVTLQITTPNPIQINGNDLFLVNNQELPVTISNSGNYPLTPSSKTKNLVPGISDHELSFNRNGTNYYKFPIKLIVTNTDQLESNVNSLAFFGIKDVREPDWQTISVYQPNETTFNNISWLDVIELSNDNDFVTYSIRPKNSSNLSAGSRTENLIFNDGTNQVSISISYNLQGLYNADYEKNYHYTQDSEELVIAKSIADNTTFINLILTIKTFGFDGKVTESERKLQYFFHESTIELDPGQLIHDMFNYYQGNARERFFYLNESTGIFPQYQFASIYFDVKEVDFDTLEVLNSFVIPTQFYIKGRKPDLPSFALVTENRLLSHRLDSFTRITRKSFIAFNYVRVASGELQFRKNGVQIPIPGIAPSVIPQGNDVKIFGGIIKASDIENLQENDILELSLNGQKLNYLVEEEGLNSVTVFYVNQHDLLSSFELTGEFLIDTSYDRVTTVSFENWVEKTRNLSTSKIQTLKINSGYIPLENVRILDEINMSEKAFILVNDKIFDVRPIISKFNNQTSKDNLVQKTLEFEFININYDDFYAF